MTKILRIFPTRTNATPDDDMVRVRTTPSLFDKALEETIHVWNMPVSERCKPYAETMNDVIRKATQILEKYGKK